MWRLSVTFPLKHGYIMLPALLACGLLVSGCGKKTVSTAPAKTVPKPAPPMFMPSSPVIHGTLGDLIMKQRQLSSYQELVIKPDGTTETHWYKYCQGKLQLMKSTGWRDHHQINDFEHKIVYSYFLKSKTGIRDFDRPCDPPGVELYAQGVDSRTFKLDTPLIDSEVFDGMKCWRLSAFDAAGDLETRVWIDDTYGLTRRRWTRKGLETYKYSMINAVPDSVFTVPAGIKIEDRTVKAV